MVGGRQAVGRVVGGVGEGGALEEGFLHFKRELTVSGSRLHI